MSESLHAQHVDTRRTAVKGIRSETKDEAVYTLDPLEVTISGLDSSKDNFQDTLDRETLTAFGSQNATNALNTLSGVALEFDQGDARFVIIRGTAPALNNITINGIPVASTSAESRAAQLDVLEIEGFESIELTKVLRPEHPADSIGGLINFTSSSAFDYPERHALLNGGLTYHKLSDQFGGQTSARFSDRFLDNTLGVFLSTSYSKRGLGSDAVEADPFTDDGFGTVPGGSLEYQEFDLDREKIGVSANIEYQPNKRNRFFARVSYNELTDDEARQSAIIDYENALEEGSLSKTGNTVVFTNNTFGPDSEDDDLEFATELQQKDVTVRQILLNLGGEHKINRWNIDYALGLSYAEENESETSVAYELDGTVDSASLLNATSDTPSLRYTSGTANPADANDYEFDEAVIEQVDSEETNWNAQINFARSFKAEWLSEIKSGLLFQFKDKETDVETIEFKDQPNSFDSLRADSNTRDFLNTQIPFVSPSMSDQFLAEQGAFTAERELEESIGGDYQSDENIYASYLQAATQWKQFEFLAGVRLEFTDFESTSAVFDESLSAPYPNRMRGNDYFNVLPGLHLTYRSKDTIDSTDAWTIRSAWTNTLARPGFEETKAGQIQLDDFVEIGNPSLDALESSNLDLSVTYDHITYGTITVGAFYKDLKNQTVSRVVFKNVDADPELEEVRTFSNSPSGHLQGLETSFEIPLAALSDSLSPFFLSGSATIIDSNSEIEDRTGDQPLLKQSDFVGKAALTWNHKGVLAKLSYNYRSEYLDEFGEEETEDEYNQARYQLDFSCSYAPTDSIILYGNIYNLTNEPIVIRYKGSNALSEYEEFGTFITVGIKYIF